MHVMLTIRTDVRGVCLSVCQSVCLSRGLNLRQLVHCTLRAVFAGSFSAAFVKLLRFFVNIAFLCSA